MWEPRCLTTLWAFMACYRDSFTSFTAFLWLKCMQKPAEPSPTIGLSCTNWPVCQCCVYRICSHVLTTDSLISLQSLSLLPCLLSSIPHYSLIDGFRVDLLRYTVYANITCKHTEYCITIISTLYHEDILLLIIFLGN
jgi:hypothetical protein